MMLGMNQARSQFTRYQSRLKLLLLPLLAIVVSFAFYLTLIYSWNTEQQLATRFFQQSFKASINQYEYLPALLARDAAVINALAQPQKDPGINLNQRFKFTAERAGASVLYLMNAAGQVVATSNYSEDNSFLNRNYAFRPYFARAKSQRKRQFYYAIGATTGIPGFFIAEPVIDSNDVAVGVVVVKLDLREWEKSWQDANQNVLVVAENNVIILSGQETWRYRTIGELSPKTLEEIKVQRQFEGAETSPLFQKRYDVGYLGGLPLSFWKIGGDAYLVNAFPISGTEWTLYYLEKNQQFIQSALIFFIVIMIGFSLAYLLYRERQSKLRSRKQAEQTMIELNESLEEKVDQRTRELRDTQAELVQQSKVAALGQMAATIVHEMSQPLSAMNSSIAATQMKAEKKDWSGSLKSLARLSPLCDKMNNVIKLLKYFSYQDDESVQVQELAPLIKQSVQLFQDKLRENRVTIQIENLESGVFVKVNALKLDLVITNIVQNAIDAMVDTTNPIITIDMKSQENRAVISITDNGCGINSRIMGQLFDPYFTTKEIGKGLGLGLSICHEIVREYNGSIQVENTEVGACFVIEIPLGKDINHPHKRL